MKKIFLVAIFICSIFALGSCADKFNEMNEEGNNNTTEVNGSKFLFPMKLDVNYQFKDNEGNIWKATGTVTLDLFATKPRIRIVAYDIVLTDPNGNTSHFQGAPKRDPEGNRLGGFEGHIYDKEGKELLLSDFEKTLTIMDDYFTIKYENDEIK